MLVSQSCQEAYRRERVHLSGTVPAPKGISLTFPSGNSPPKCGEGGGGRLSHLMRVWTLSPSGVYRETVKFTKKSQICFCKTRPPKGSPAQSWASPAENSPLLRRALLGLLGRELDQRLRARGFFYFKKKEEKKGDLSPTAFPGG